MTRVNPGDYGTSRPKIEPTDLDDTWAVLEIAGFEETEQDDPEAESGKRKAAFLTFTETGEKVCWLNVTGIRCLVDVYGDNTDNWIGQLCPVEEVRGTAFGKSYHKVAVAARDSWDEYVEIPKPKPAPKKKTAKRGRSKK